MLSHIQDFGVSVGIISVSSQSTVESHLFFLFKRAFRLVKKRNRTEVKAQPYTIEKKTVSAKPLLSELKKMPNTRFSGSVSSPDVSVTIDMGHPFLNHTVDGFLKIGAIAATRAVAEDVFHVVKKGSISKGNVEHTLKKMCKEGAYWGTVAGVYVGMDYGIERVRGTRDWKNAMIGGALTGALVSIATSQDKDKIVINAITGGAIATASEFINYLT